MAEIRRLKVEPLSGEVFEPYGELLVPKPHPPHFRGIQTEGWLADFEITGSPQIMVMRSYYQGFTFTKLERHLNVSQTFILTGGSPSVIAFSPPTDPADPQSIPDPSDVRAFFLQPPIGYVLKTGAWHSLDRYPLYPPHCDFVIITAHETTEELKHVDRSQWRLTQEVDYEATAGVTFEFVL